jgi:cytochrome c-type biogenesis protein CcmH/NrfG
MFLLESDASGTLDPTGETGMANAPTSDSAASESLQSKQVYMMAAICLAVGLGIGYVSRGLQAPPPAAASATRSVTTPAGGGHAPTLDDMRHIADQQAAPLLAQLKANPSDSNLLMQVGAIYHGNHQFKEAAGYYDKAVHADPKNVALRSRLAASLYRSGDADGAIAQLNEALTYDPKDANSLFNLGMIKLQGKADGKGAIAAWQRLLKANPQLSAERNAEVQKLMADVMTTMGETHGMKGAPSR